MDDMLPKYPVSDITSSMVETIYNAKITVVDVNVL